VLIDVGDAENVSDTVFDAPKLAVFEGMVAGVQFPAMFQSLVAGFRSQVASWACAAPTPRDAKASSGTARPGPAKATGILRLTDAATLCKKLIRQLHPKRPLDNLEEIITGSQRLKELNSSSATGCCFYARVGCGTWHGFFERQHNWFGSGAETTSMQINHESAL
jgi:hypothetical protein